MSAVQWLRPIDPNSAGRYKFEKKFWYSQMAIWTAMFTWLPAVFELLWRLYTVLVSIYALALTADGNENSAEAREAARNDDDVEPE